MNIIIYYNLLAVKLYFFNIRKVSAPRQQHTSHIQRPSQTENRFQSVGKNTPNQNLLFSEIG